MIKREAKRIVVLGCGYVGAALAEQLGSRGHGVVGVRRSGADDASKERIAMVEADVLDRASITAVLQEADRVVYSVGASERTDAAYQRAYVDGLDNVLAILRARRAPPERVLFTSSTAVYAQHNGEWVDEESPTEPTDFAGRRLLEAEALLRESGLPTVSLRLGGIYGPGRTRFLRRALAGDIPFPRVPTYRNRIHRDDCAGAIAHLLLVDAPAPVYVGVDRDPADLRDVLRFIQRELGATSAESETDSESQSRSESQSQSQSQSASRGKRARSTRLVASGYRFLYPSYRQGYRALHQRLGREAHRP